RQPAPNASGAGKTACGPRCTAQRTAPAGTPCSERLRAAEPPPPVVRHRGPYSDEQSHIISYLCLRMAGFGTNRPDEHSATVASARFHIHTARLLRSLAGGCISLILCFLLYIVFDIHVLDHLAPQEDETDVINYFYSIENRRPDAASYSCFYDDRIVLFDLEGTQSRGVIAAAIERIDSCAPAAILLDVIFPQAAAADAAED